ncbi:MAG: NAD(P)H-hydrate epimerase [Gemmatimonadota bacterium]
MPVLTTDEMRTVDRSMIVDFRIELIQMMESAGYVLAALARERFFGGDPVGRRVLVVCGRGNNGGGGLVCARRLHAWGANVRVLTTRPPEDFLGIPEHQLDIIQRMDVPLTHAAEPTVLGDFDLVVDAIIGYGLEGAPRDESARLIALANDLGPPILSLDVPSGLDATTGQAPGASVRADVTLTLALPKIGLTRVSGREHVGELYVGDIGVPPELYAGRGLGYDVGPLFAQQPFVRV